jgi:hypothetical protein
VKEILSQRGGSSLVGTLIDDLAAKFAADFDVDQVSIL